MAILGKLKDSSNNEDTGKNYVLPSVVTKSDDALSFKKSVVLSTILHPMTMFVIWLVITILALLGVRFDILKKPEMPPKDIEFVLVNNPEQTPINKQTKNRADRNTRAGGKHNPKKPQAEPSPAPGGSKAAKPKPPKTKKTTPSSASSDLVKQIQKKQAQQAQQAPQPKTAQVNKPAAPAAPKHVTPTPTPPAPRPAPAVSAPKVTTNPTSAMQIPVPKTTAPKLAGSYGGPVTASRAGTGSSVGTSSGNSSGSGRPAPSFAPSSGGSSSSTGRFSSAGSGGGYGYGQAGNPGPGNPNGRPGIDAIKEPDFGPYMRELQRRIKMNWDPPKGNESKRVVLLFKIAKDGRLLSVKVSRSSGVPAADRAAIHAVELTAPFKPLPAEFRGQNVDIQFTFDYNVFGASRY